MDEHASSSKRQKVENDSPEKKSACLLILPQKIQKRRLEILLNACRKKKFKVLDKLSKEVSHIVTELSSRSKVEQALKLAPDSLGEGVAVVSTDWLSASIKEGTILHVDESQRILQDIPVEETCDIKEHEFPDYACQRVALLQHHNSKFTEALEVLELNADFNDEYSRSLAFRRGACVLKSWPRPLVRRDEILGLKNMGNHCVRVIQDILENGCSSEAEEIKNSSWFQKMKLFTGVFGVGRSTAEKWIDAGLSTIEEVRQTAQVTRRNDPKVSLGLVYYEDLNLPVLRREADAVQQLIQKEVRVLLPGATVELMGGFRRGKAAGHDIDLLLSHPDEGKECGLLTRLLLRLEEMGLVLHGSIEGSTFTDTVLKNETKLHNLKGQLDHFEKWIGMIKINKSAREESSKSLSQGQNEISRSPEDHKEGRMEVIGPSTSHNHQKELKSHRVTMEENEKVAEKERMWLARRVDLIIVPRSQYYYAVVGWTGSKHFNRSLRLYAQRELNMRLTSHGLYDYNQGKSVPAESEKDVFANISLDYREPWERNC